MDKSRETNRPKQQSAPRHEFSAYDRALIKAVQAGNRVTFILATGDTIPSARVCAVDKFQIEIEWSGDGPIRADYTSRREWINKSLIARTRIDS